MLDLVGFICIQVSKFGHQPRGSFFSTVAMTGFWFTGIMFLLYLFQIVYKAQRIPWLQIEMWFSAAITLFFLLASALAADMGSGAYIAAAVSLPFIELEKNGKNTCKNCYLYFVSNSFSAFAQCAFTVTMRSSSTDCCKAPLWSCNEPPSSHQRRKSPNFVMSCGTFG